MKKVLFLILAAGFGAVLFAQDPVAAADSSNISTSLAFFAAVFSGIVIALAFQLLLTNLSAASGLTAARAITQDDHDGHARSSDGQHTSLREKTDKIHSTVRKVSAGFGAWTVVTASLSLFLGTLLAVSLTGAFTYTYGIVVGLVVWGLFYFISMSFELSMGSSMVSAMGSMVKHGFKAVTDTAGAATTAIADTASSVFSKSDAHKAADEAEAITKAVKQELFGHMDLKKQLHGLIREMKPDFTPRDFRKELETLLSEIEVETFVSDTGGPGGIPAIMQEIRTNQSGMDQERAKSAVHTVKEAISKIKEENQSYKREADRTVDAAMRVSGMSREEAEETRRKIEAYLRNTGKEELNPEGIKRDLEQLFHDPKGGAQSLKRRLSHLDRSTAVAVLEQRPDMTHEDAVHTVDRVMSVVDQVVGKVTHAAETTQERAGSMKADTGSAIESKKQQALAKLEDYLASLDRPGTLDPEAVRAEVELLFHDPKEGADALYHRAKNLSREDIMTIVSSNKYIKREDAEKVADRIMETRDQVLERVQRMKEEVEHRIEQAKQEIEHRVEQAKEEALHQADETRKTAATAAWWIFIAAVVSAIASVFGGYVALWL